MNYVEQDIDEVDSNISNIVDEYDSTVTYDVSDKVRVGAYIYKSTATNNTGNYPLDNLATYWFKWGVSNAHSMFDLLEETKTEWTANGEVTFKRGTKAVIGIGNFKATQIKIEYLDASKVAIAGTEEIYTFSSNGNVYDVWSYGYGGFTDSVSETVFSYLRKIGTYIKITFSAGGHNTNCGYCIAGTIEDMGETEDKVSFPDTRIGSRTVNKASFTTYVARNDLMRKTTKAKLKINDTMMFIIDPSENSYHSNMIILGKITKVDGEASNWTLNTMSWTIEQTILT